jgi:hypothetical protein
MIQILSTFTRQNSKEGYDLKGNGATELFERKESATRKIVMDQRGWQPGGPLTDQS